MEQSDHDDPPGWYRAVVTEYFQDGSCKLVYDDNSNVTVSEIVDPNSVEWMSCAKGAKRYVPMDCAPKSLLRRWKPSTKYYASLEHSVKGYADDATLISVSTEAHISVLQQIAGPKIF